MGIVGIDELDRRFPSKPVASHDIVDLTRTAADCWLACLSSDDAVRFAGGFCAPNFSIAGHEHWSTWKYIPNRFTGINRHGTLECLLVARGGGDNLSGRDSQLFETAFNHRRPRSGFTLSPDLHLQCLAELHRAHDLVASPASASGDAGRVVGHWFGIRTAKGNWKACA